VRPSRATGTGPPPRLFIIASRSVMLSGIDEVTWPSDGLNAVEVDDRVEVIGRGLEVEESLLSGESKLFDKHESNTVWSGSVVAAGTATVKLSKVSLLLFGSRRGTNNWKILVSWLQFRPTLFPVGGHATVKI
jgi:hypothetical protein